MSIREQRDQAELEISLVTLAIRQAELAHATAAQSLKIERIGSDEKTFRWLFNEDAMATEKTAEGIRNFGKDIVKLEKLIEAGL